MDKERDAQKTESTCRKAAEDCFEKRSARANTKTNVVEEFFSLFRI